MASKCISKLAQLWPPIVSPNSLDYCRQVCTIMASKCSSTLALLQPPSLSYHGLQVHICKLAQSQPPTLSSNMLEYCLQVPLLTYSIISLECISVLTWW
jgi:hypothetical protein